jgi:hypothetical protein
MVQFPIIIPIFIAPRFITVLNLKNFPQIAHWTVPTGFREQLYSYLEVILAKLVVGRFKDNICGKLVPGVI